MSAPITLYRDREDRFGLIHGDALELLWRIPEGSVDAVVTDPPYAIGLNRETWDRPGGSGAGFSSWTMQWAEAARRVLKPGGHLLAFGAPRTSHRLTTGIEDAGFEIRDQLMWLCGQGVPKGRRLPGGPSTTLRPGYEPIVMARSPLGEQGGQPGLLAVGDSGTRWPQNVVMTHTTLCQAGRCTRRCPLRLMERGAHELRPSRFFYAPKASRREREAGTEHLPARDLHVFGSQHRAGALRRNIHPTVKPLPLMRWLLRLVCPEGGVLLDPFTGSGSTGAAAMLEGRSFIGIEQEAEYVDIALARLAHWSQQR